MRRIYYLISFPDEVIPMQPEKIKDLAEEDDECEVYEDEDFVTVSSSLASSISEIWPCLIE